MAIYTTSHSKKEIDKLKEEHEKKLKREKEKRAEANAKLVAEQKAKKEARIKENLEKQAAMAGKRQWHTRSEITEKADKKIAVIKEKYEAALSVHPVADTYKKWIDDALFKPLCNKSSGIEYRVDAFISALRSEQYRQVNLPKGSQDIHEYALITEIRNFASALESLINTNRKDLRRDDYNNASPTKKLEMDGLNIRCRHFNRNADGELSCSAGMDMTFCGMKCAFATNVPGSTKVN